MTGYPDGQVLRSVSGAEGSPRIELIIVQYPFKIQKAINYCLLRTARLLTGCPDGQVLRSAPQRTEEKEAPVLSGVLCDILLKIQKAINYCLLLPE